MLMKVEVERHHPRLTIVLVSLRVDATADDDAMTTTTSGGGGSEEDKDSGGDTPTTIN